MRARNKKIVLIESLNHYPAQKDTKFIDHHEEQMPMRICRNQTENEGCLAEIFYEALLNESISKRNIEKAPETPQTQKLVKSAMLPTDASEKRCNSGRIIRRSLSKNCSNSSSPECHPKEVIRVEPTSVVLSARTTVRERTSTSRVSSKENCKMTPTNDKAVRSSRRSISNKKQIKYTVKTHFRS